MPRPLTVINRAYVSPLMQETELVRSDGKVLPPSSETATVTHPARGQ